MLKALRDNLALLAFLVLLVGVSNSEAYYAAFGLRYQFLGLSPDHVLYRGLTAVFQSWLIAILYLIAMILILGQGRMALVFKRIRTLRILNYVFVAVLSIAAWLVGGYAGRMSAEADVTEASSPLPKIQSLVLAGESDSLARATLDGYRLLMQTSSGVYVFKPVAKPRDESPLIQFIPGASIEVLKLCARC